MFGRALAAYSRLPGVNGHRNAVDGVKAAAAIDESNDVTLTVLDRGRQVSLCHDVLGHIAQFRDAHDAGAPVCRSWLAAARPRHRLPVTVRWWRLSRLSVHLVVWLLSAAVVLLAASTLVHASEFSAGEGTRLRGGSLGADLFLASCVACACALPFCRFASGVFARPGSPLERAGQWAGVLTPLALRCAPLPLVCVACDVAVRFGWARPASVLEGRSMTRSLVFVVCFASISAPVSVLHRVSTGLVVYLSMVAVTLFLWSLADGALCNLRTPLLWACLTTVVHLANLARICSPRFRRLLRRHRSSSKARRLVSIGALASLNTIGFCFFVAMGPCHLSRRCTDGASSAHHLGLPCPAVMRRATLESTPLLLDGWSVERTTAEDAVAQSPPADASDGAARRRWTITVEPSPHRTSQTMHSTDGSHTSRAIVRSIHPGAQERSPQLLLAAIVIRSVCGSSRKRRQCIVSSLALYPQSVSPHAHAYCPQPNSCQHSPRPVQENKVRWPGPCSARAARPPELESQDRRDGVTCPRWEG